MELTREREFNQVYAGAYSKIRNFQRRLCLNIEQAEDLTQETFIRAYNAFDSFDRKCLVENWLMRVAYNVFLDHVRKVKRRISAFSESQIGEGNVMESVHDPENAIDDAVSHSAMQSQIELVMSKLDPALAQLLSMHYLQEMSYDEIAKALGASVGTIRSRLYRACKAANRVAKLHDIELEAA